MICGLPLYEYDHLVPYAEVKEHAPENIVLLCDQHHREKGSGLLPLAQVEAANRAPVNVTSGESYPYGLHYGGETCETRIGPMTVTWPQLAEGSLAVPILIDDTPIVAFRIEDGRLLLTAQIFDSENRLLMQVIDNELVYSTRQWDVEMVGRHLTLRAGLGDVSVEIAFEPPATFAIQRGHVWRNGLEFRVSERIVEYVNAENTFEGNVVLVVRAASGIGLGVGDPPAGSTIGFVLGDGERAPYTAHADTELRTRRLVPTSESR